MANEITLSARFAVQNGAYDPGTINVSNLSVTQAAVGAAGDIQNVGTSEETLGAGGLSTKGWLFIRNLDTANYVQLGFSTGVYGCRLEAGEFAFFRTEPAATVYLKADTGACNVQYRWLED